MALDYFCCDIYVRATDATSTSADSRLEIETNKDKLHMWYAKLFAFMDRKLGDFVWNREPLLLFVDMLPRISGRMIHGDAVDDEWLAVWLLREATREYDELIVSVRDSDGEFLLAEAAMHIPHWITPENSEHRVYIYRNQLHIVPLSAGSENIGINDALAAVMDSGVFTLASAPAAAAAFSRLDDYPAKISQSMHRARCKLPVALARAISDQPQLIAAASEAFYDREPTQMNVCQRMSQFPPEPSVMVSVSAGAMSEDLLAKHAFHELSATVSGEWQPTDTAIASEDESWLALNSDELDTVMRKAESVLHDAAQSDPASEFAADDDDDRTAQDLQSMLAKFESFLAADSGIEGANVMK
ncbi:hypothetical protein GGF49_001791 [Coemansia sp. RSA 1853]|nr:hypothetical protein GGF49_001791 [Coemansia sp. RSA 1853]